MHYPPEVCNTDPMIENEHTHAVRYLAPNTLGLARSRGGNEPYVNVIMGQTRIINVEDCRKAGCREGS